MQKLVYPYHFLTMSNEEFLREYGEPRRVVKRFNTSSQFLKDLRDEGVGEACPTCRVRMKHSSLRLPESVTVEHVVPLCTGGKNEKHGVFPNCIAMCYACNKARNDVLMVFGKKISTVKFLLEQVYSHPLNTKMEVHFHKQLAYHQGLSAPRRVPRLIVDRTADFMSAAQ